MTEKAVAEAMENLISLTAKPLDKSRLSFEIATEGLVYSDENIRVSYTPTRHIAVLNRPSYSIIIECEGKRVIFSGDMSQHLAEGDFPEAAYEECDLLVCELAHFGIPELTPYLDRVKTKRFAFTHASERKFGDIAELAASGKYSFEILHPNDGDTLEF
jgi:hypothetical protein